MYIIKPFVGFIDVVFELVKHVSFIVKFSRVFSEVGFAFVQKQVIGVIY